MLRILFNRTLLNDSFLLENVVLKQFFSTWQTTPPQSFNLEALSSINASSFLYFTSHNNNLKI